jgi:F-type H+-transporting ATPase subunit b
MSLLLPQLGLFIWSLVIFLVVFFLLRKMAWKPVLAGLKKREESIQKSLDEAAAAREAMAQLKSDNERILQEARAEREQIIKEANAAKDRIVSEARGEAQKQAEALLRDARQQIELETRKAMADVKATSAKLAVEVAEKILRKQFADGTAQQQYAEQLIAELNMN